MQRMTRAKQPRGDDRCSPTRRITTCDSEPQTRNPSLGTLLKPSEVAERLGTSRSHVYDLIQSRAIAVHRVGRGQRGAVRISEVDLEAYLADCRIEATKPVRATPAPRLKHLKL